LIAVCTATIATTMATVMATKPMMPAGANLLPCRDAPDRSICDPAMKPKTSPRIASMPYSKSNSEQTKEAMAEPSVLGCGACP
jgi:hypothetical protein